MSGFTPGPWKWTGDFDYFALSGPGPDDEVITDGGYDGRWLAYVEQRDANARLIAAAPELYEALTMLLEDLDQGADPVSPECRARTGSYDKARAVLAKVDA